MKFVVVVLLTRCKKTLNASFIAISSGPNASANEHIICMFFSQRFVLILKFVHRRVWLSWKCVKIRSTLHHRHHYVYTFQVSDDSRHFLDHIPDHIGIVNSFDFRHRTVVLTLSTYRWTNRAALQDPTCEIEHLIHHSDLSQCVQEIIMSIQQYTFVATESRSTSKRQTWQDLYQMVDSSSRVISEIRNSWRLLFQ